MKNAERIQLHVVDELAYDASVHPPVMVAGDDTTIAETALRAFGSWAEKEAAERAAFAALGVTSVKNLLEVRHHAPVF
jgi:hypothetical protein